MACEESGAGSFGICLVSEILTYVEYAAVSSPASSFKIVPALQIRRTRSEWKEISRSVCGVFHQGGAALHIWRGGSLLIWLSMSQLDRESVIFAPKILHYII